MHVIIYTDLGNVKGKNYVKREITILKSHFSTKLQKVFFLVSQFYSQLLLVNQITVQLSGLKVCPTAIVYINTAIQEFTILNIFNMAARINWFITIHLYLTLKIILTNLNFRVATLN